MASFAMGCKVKHCLTLVHIKMPAQLHTYTKGNSTLSFILHFNNIQDMCGHQGWASTISLEWSLH